MVRGEELITLFAKYFPECPICDAKAEYKVVGLFGANVQCKSCLATWAWKDFMGGKEIRSLQLCRSDRQGKSKPLLGRTKSVGFWQSTDFERFDPSLEKEIKGLINEVLHPRAEANRIEALDRLRAIGGPAFQQVSEMYYKSDATIVRKDPLWLLGLLKDERGLDLLIQALKENQQIELREVALWSLASIEEAQKTGKAIEPLIDALKNDKDPRVRIRAVQALELVNGDARVVDALIEALDDWGEWQTGKGSIFGIEFPTEYAYVAHQAASALIGMRDKIGLAPLVPVVLRVTCPQSLAEKLLRDEGQPAVEHLIPGLQMEQSGSRQRAAAYLGVIGDAHAIEPLQAASRDDENSSVRLTAVYALAKIKDPKVVDALIPALKDNDWRIRSATAEALGGIKDVRAVEALAQALNDESVDVRTKAAEALGGIGDGGALHALTRAREDRARAVRSAAQRALEKIKAKRS